MNVLLNVSELSVAVYLMASFILALFTLKTYRTFYIEVFTVWLNLGSPIVCFIQPNFHLLQLSSLILNFPIGLLCLTFFLSNKKVSKFLDIFYDLVNTKEKRKFVLIICVPFYIAYGMATYVRYIGFSENMVSTVFSVGIILWFTFLYLFFFQTERGKKLRKIVEEQ